MAVNYEHVQNQINNLKILDGLEEGLRFCPDLLETKNNNHVKNYILTTCKEIRIIGK